MNTQLLKQDAVLETIETDGLSSLLRKEFKPKTDQAREAVDGGSGARRRLADGDESVPLGGRSVSLHRQSRPARAMGSGARCRGGTALPADHGARREAGFPLRGGLGHPDLPDGRHLPATGSSRRETRDRAGHGPRLPHACPLLRPRGGTGENHGRGDGAVRHHADHCGRSFGDEKQKHIVFSNGTQAKMILILEK